MRPVGRRGHEEGAELKRRTWRETTPRQEFLQSVVMFLFFAKSFHFLLSMTTSAAGAPSSGGLPSTPPSSPPSLPLQTTLALHALLPVMILVGCKLVVSWREPHNSYLSAIAASVLRACFPFAMQRNATRRLGHLRSMVDPGASGLAQGLRGLSLQKKKARVLCLHGYENSGPILKKQLQMGGWIKEFGDLCDFVFVSAPFTSVPPGEWRRVPTPSPRADAHLPSWSLSFER